MAMARFAHNKKIDEDNMRDLEQNTLTGAEETKLQYDYIEKASPAPNRLEYRSISVNKSAKIGSLCSILLNPFCNCSRLKELFLAASAK